VVGANTYLEGEGPYVVAQVTAAAVAELARKRTVKAVAESPRQAPVDPEAARQRAQAAELKIQATARLREASAEAVQIVIDAKADMEKERLQAREEAFAQGLTQGSEEGYEEGLKKGEEEGLGRWAELMSRWQSLLEATVKEKENYLADRERILVDLALKISAKILAKEVSQRPQDIQIRVLEAIKKATDRQVLMVHLHPEDLTKALETDSAALRSVHGVKQIEFVADDKVVRGGVRVESATETIDAGLDTQLAEIAKGLLEEAYHAD
jgi:flagellar assembly protein FliH